MMTGSERILVLASAGFFNPFPGAQQSPPVAAQDLTMVFKAGYLEKRRKGWCSAKKINVKIVF